MPGMTNVNGGRAAKDTFTGVSDSSKKVAPTTSSGGEKKSSGKTTTKADGRVEGVKVGRGVPQP